MMMAGIATTFAMSPMLRNRQGIRDILSILHRRYSYLYIQLCVAKSYLCVAT